MFNNELFLLNSGKFMNLYWSFKEKALKNS